LNHWGQTKIVPHPQLIA